MQHKSRNTVYNPIWTNMKYIFYAFFTLVLCEYLTFDFEETKWKPSYYLVTCKTFLVNGFKFLGAEFAYYSEKLISYIQFEKFAKSVCQIFDPIIFSLSSPVYSIVGYTEYVKAHISTAGMIYTGSTVIILAVLYVIVCRRYRTLATDI